MDLKEAQLIRRVVEKLTCSEGIPPSDIAQDCDISMRRATFLLMCMEQAGLVCIGRDGKVRIATVLVRHIYRHSKMLERNWTRAKEAKRAAARAYFERVCPNGIPVRSAK